MISTSSRKDQDRRLQNKVRDLILEKFDLHPDDVQVLLGESEERYKIITFCKESYFHFQ